MDSKTSNLKRHILSATRVFISAFLGTITVQLAALPMSGWKDYLISMMTSALIAGLSSLIKVINESTISPK